VEISQVQRKGRRQSCFKIFQYLKQNRFLVKLELRHLVILRDFQSKGFGLEFKG